MQCATYVHTYVPKRAMHCYDFCKASLEVRRYILRNTQAVGNEQTQDLDREAANST